MAKIATQDGTTRKVRKYGRHGLSRLARRSLSRKLAELDRANRPQFPDGKEKGASMLELKAQFDRKIEKAESEKEVCIDVVGEPFVCADEQLPVVFPGEDFLAISSMEKGCEEMESGEDCGVTIPEMEDFPHELILCDNNASSPDNEEGQQFKLPQGRKKDPWSSLIAVAAAALFAISLFATDQNRVSGEPTSPTVIATSTPASAAAELGLRFEVTGENDPKYPLMEVMFLHVPRENTELASIAKLKSPGLDPGQSEPVLYFRAGLDQQEKLVAYFTGIEEAKLKMEEIAPLVNLKSSDGYELEFRKLPVSKVDQKRLAWAIRQFDNSIAG